MPDGTGATEDNVNRAIEALTRSDLLRLKHFAVWRLHGLGRAGCGERGGERPCLSGMRVGHE